MAVEITWSTEATETFEEIVNYLSEHWGDKEIGKFVQQTEKIVTRLRSFPEAYPYGNGKRYRKVRLNKVIVLFYVYRKSSDRIVLLSFWNLKRDPTTIKF